MSAPAPAPASRSVAWRLAQLGLTAVVIALAVWKLWGQWSSASPAELRFQLNIPAFLAASAIVFVTYLVLIETWRRVLALLGAPVAFAPAARVWFASNLGKYIPGKIWTLTGLVVLVGREGVSAPAAGASAIVMTIAQVASGFAVVMFASTDVVRQLTGGTTALLVATAGMIASLAAAPLIAGQWNRLAVRLGREQLRVDVPFAAIVLALVGCTLSWFMYGLAFQLLVHSITGTSGPFFAYTAAYASSYLFGFLMIFAPGGIGARELALTTVLPVLGLSTPVQAAMITVVSRLWLTAVELLPSVIAAVRTAAASRPR